MTPPSTSSATRCGATSTTPASPSTTRPARSSTPASSAAPGTSCAARGPTTSPPRSTTRASATSASPCARAATPWPACRSSTTASSSTCAACARSPSTPSAASSRAGAGLTWAELDEATQAHGLATVGGRVSSTGVAGLALGGGSGWLERKHGLACDNILAVELVTATGAEVRASADEHPELFWALRGGGGNFGVVTAIEFALHPVGPAVLGGLLLHPAERGRELLRLFRDVMHDAPDELSLAFVYLTAPDEDEIPAELRGRPAVAIAGMHAGPIEDAERALAPIREYGPPALDAFAPVGYADFQRSIDDPPGYRNWWTAEYLDDLTDEAIEAVASLSEQLPAGPAQIFIPAWGGAVARVPEDATPLAKRDARFVVHPLLLWEDAAEDERMIAFGRRYREVLAPHRNGGTYLNFIGDEGADRVRAAYGPNHDRLARVKAGWDPDNVFRATGNVRAGD